MKELILASNNAHKVEEIKSILEDYSILTLKDINYTEEIVEDGTTFEENALIKEKVLLELNGQKSKAKFVSVIALVKPDGTELTFRGECHGEIIFEKRGTNGFGYDPIFYVPSLDKTFAELSANQKNSISHRKQSLEKFSQYLKEESDEN